MISYLNNQNTGGKTPKITSVDYDPGIGTSTIGTVTIHLKNTGVRYTYYYMGTSQTPTSWIALTDSEAAAHQIITNVYIKGTYYIWVVDINGAMCKAPASFQATTTFLYSWGKQFTDITGGWKTGVGQYGGTVTFNADNIYINGVNNEQGVATATTYSSIDVTPYNSLNSYVYTASHPSPYEGEYGTNMHPNNTTLGISSQYKAYLTTGQYIGQYTTNSLDVSSLNVSLYPVLSVLSQINTYTYQVYLQ